MTPTSLLNLLNRFENAAGVYERSDDPADRDELHAARRAIMEAFTEMRVALRAALYAVDGAADLAGIEDEPCDFDELCGNRLCDECGCIQDKREGFRTILARAAIHPSLEQE